MRERFDAKWMAEPTSGCWLWLAGLSHGYGTFRVGRRMQHAQRVAWSLYRGPIPDGQNVLHHCDNPACVNPSHLFLGTDADNVADKCAKRRQPRGETHGRRKLSRDEVNGIRAGLAAGVLQAELGRRFGVAQSVVSRIKNGVLWCEQTNGGAV